MAPRRKPGRPTSNLSAFDDLVESLIQSGPVDTAALALAQVGRTLASVLDERPEGVALAPLAKEFRAVIADLVGAVSHDDDDDTFGSILPSAVRDRPKL